jgi:hypothetical protein
MPAMRRFARTTETAMPKRKPKIETELETALAAVEAARNFGADYYKQHPEWLLVEAARYAAGLFCEVNHQIAFLQGFSRARILRDDYEREQNP